MYGAWLTPWEAMHFLTRPTIDALTRWVTRHGIIRRGDGAVAKADLQRELDRMRRHPRRGRHPHSQANLRRGHIGTARPNEHELEVGSA